MWPQPLYVIFMLFISNPSKMYYAIEVLRCFLLLLSTSFPYISDVYKIIVVMIKIVK